MKYKITKIYKKDGVSKSGNPWSKINIQTEEKGEEWLSGFATNTSLAWQVGDEVDLEVTTREYEGKIYYDYKIIPDANNPEDRLAKLEKRMKEFELSMTQKFADLKADLVLETTGAFQTTKDYEKMNKDYPVKSEMDSLVEAMQGTETDDIPF